MNQRPGIRSALLTLVVAGALSACTNLAAVRDWSGTSLQGVQFAEIVETYADTPARLAVYDAGDAAAHEAQGEIRARQAQALRLQLALVADYMAALNALAADGVTDYSADVGQLQASLAGTGLVSQGTVGAAGRLASTLLNAAAGAWQRRQVGALVAQANAPLQAILAGELRAIVERDFRRDLEIEAQFLNRYYKDLLRDPDSSPAGKAALQEWFVLRTAENARRLAAVDAYLAILATVADGHQALYDGREDLGAKALAKQLFKLAKEIRARLKDILSA